MEGKNDPFLSVLSNVLNNNPPLQIDCTGIVESLRGEFGKIVEEQQTQINELVASVHLLVNKLVDKPADNVRPNAQEVPPEQLSAEEITNKTTAGSNVNELTPPASILADDDKISLAGSNVWFQSVKSMNGCSSSRHPPPSYSHASGGTASLSGEKSVSKENDGITEPSQKLWQEATVLYESTNQASGPEISSSIAKCSQNLLAPIVKTRCF